MRNRFWMLLLLLMAATTMATAQTKKAYKFGSILPEELEMTHYEADPDAEAVVLYERTYIDHEFANGNVYQIIELTRRIKVLKESGTSQGDITLHLFVTPEMKMTLKELTASAYNLVDGKRVESKLKKQYIFEEQASENELVIKASIPDVRVGTVIEFRHAVRSPIIQYIPTIFFQDEIPVVHSEATICTPQYFRFQTQQRGHHPITLRRSMHTAIASLGQNTHETYMVNQIDVTATNVPALRKEPFVWNMDEYRTQLSFELAAIDIPGVASQTIAFTWKDVFKYLDESPFGEHLKMGNPLRDELKAAMPADADEQTKIRTAIDVLTKQIKWNEDYAIFCDSPARALHKHEGDSAEINFLLMAMLRDLGFEPQVVLLSPRDENRLRQNVSLNDLHYFILRLVLSDGTVCYVDGTNPNSDLNLLPIHLLVDHARIYNDPQTVLDLTALTRNSQTESISARFNEDLSLAVEKTCHRTGLNAFTENEQYDKAESEEAYIEKIEQSLDTKIDHYTLKRTKNLVTTQLSYTKSLDVAGDRIYLNITIDPTIEENPFTQSERKMPIEFGFPYTKSVRCNIQLPDGYVVEELPRSTRMAGNNGDLGLTFIAKAAGNVVQTSFTLQLKRIIYSAEEYADLKAFFGQVADLAAQQIVLKRAE